MDSDGEENALIKASLDCDLPALRRAIAAGEDVNQRRRPHSDAPEISFAAVPFRGRGGRRLRPLRARPLRAPGRDLHAEAGHW